MEALPIATVANRHILVVGGTRGIGRVLCERLVEAGASVTLTGRDGAAAARAADRIATASKGEVDGKAFDGTGPCVQKQAAELFEGVTPDTLVVNAATSPVYTRPEKIPLETWNEILAVNLTAPFILATAYARTMMAQQRQGSIVFVSSIAGLRGTRHLTAYGASKAGLIGLTQHLAVEWAPHGIRVNAVAPGWVQTDMTAGLHSHETIGKALLDSVPIGRIADPREIVDVIAFLASDSARYVTGSVYSVDGGMAAR